MKDILVAAQHPMCFFSIGTYSDQVADKQVPRNSGPGKSLPEGDGGGEQSSEG